MASQVVFICHATPDDNDFVRWLGARLTGCGYKVWADLFDLKGGTPFWSTIESALRNDAIKVIYVVSKNSIGADRVGVRNELSVADSVRKSRKDPQFIIPVRIDRTPFGDLPIQVHQLNAIDFSVGWGAKLVELIDTLESANVPKPSDVDPAAFSRWLDIAARSVTAIVSAPETVVTNLIPIHSVPKTLTFFEAPGESDKVAAYLERARIPHKKFYKLLISFADLSGNLTAVPPDLARVRIRAHVPFSAFLAGEVRDVTSPLRDEARNMAVSLIKQHIEGYLVERGLRRFETASGASFYFPSGILPNNKISYVASSGRRTNKNVVGRSERNRVNWHLSMKVNVTLGSNPIIRFKPYVCFSEDGQTAIADAKRTSAIRRRFCRNWWNQHWRQLQEAFCTFFSEGNEEVEISLGGTQKLVVAGQLLKLTAMRRIPDDNTFSDLADDPEEPKDEDDVLDWEDQAEDEAADIENSATMETGDSI